MADDKENFEDREYENSLAYRIGDLENYYADNILSEDLVEIYAEVQKNCEDFRENIFFKNLDILEESLVTIYINLIFTLFNLGKIQYPCWWKKK
jgi:hypothetical protein